MIDELVLTLGLDPTKFTEGQKKAVAAIKQLEEQATKTGSEVESHSKKLLDFFVVLKRQALEAAAVFFGGRGVGEMVNHLTRMDASVSRLAPLLNVSTEALAKWRIAMREMGFSAEDADAAIAQVSSTIQDFITNPANAPTGFLTMLQRMGIPGETNPIKILEAAGRFAQTPEMLAHPEQFNSMMTKLLGLSSPMIQLLRELGPRMKEAEPLVPAGGGLGGFSKEFISSINRFSIAAENVARVLLDHFVPALDSITGLLTRWLNPAEGDNTHYQKLHNELRQKFGAPPAWLSNIFGLPPEGPAPKLVPRGDTGIGGVFGGATGFSVEEGGVVINSGTFPTAGAKGAAAVSNVNNARTSSRTSTTTSEVNIGTINVNAPNATDAPGIANSIKPALGSSLAAPINSAY